MFVCAWSKYGVDIYIGRPIPIQLLQYHTVQLGVPSVSAGVHKLQSLSITLRDPFPRSTVGCAS